MEASLVPAVETELVEGMEPGWRVRTLADADWCLEELAKCTQAQKQDDELLKARIARLKEWHAAEKERRERRYAFFHSHLKAYAEANRATLLEGKKKSRALPSGVISWRKGQPKLEVKDAELFMGWLKALPEDSALVRVKREPEVKALKAHIEATGEVPDGCDVVPGGDEFQVKFDGGEE